MSPASRRSVWWWIAMFAAVAPFGWPPAALAQTNNNGGNRSLPASSPPRVVQVYNYGGTNSRADLMRAQGERAESFGHYLKLVAEAQLLQQEYRRREIEIRIERIKSFYEVRRIRWEERELERDRVVQAKKNQFERRTDVLKSLPNESATAGGVAGLNDLLDRIQMNSLSDLQLNTKPVDLPPGTMEDLYIWQGKGNKKARVQIQGPYALNVPRLFKKERFADTLTAYQTTRERMLTAIKDGKEVSNEDIDGATELLKQLGELLDEEIGPKKWSTNAEPRYQQFKESEKFIQEQVKQVGLFTVAKKLPPPFQGKTVQDLIAYMKSFGYRFAPALPGGENTYNALFMSVRDLFKQNN